MKRSEMVKIIQSETTGFVDNFDQELLARRILGAIEKAGMQPPISRFFVEENIEDRWGVVDFGKTQVVRVIKNKWEPEDEKE